MTASSAARPLSSDGLAISADIKSEPGWARRSATSGRISTRNGERGDRACLNVVWIGQGVEHGNQAGGFFPQAAHRTEEAPALVPRQVAGWRPLCRTQRPPAPSGRRSASARADARTP